MKAISVYDLQLIPELSKMTVFDLIHPDNDHIVNPFLAQMGFDTQYPLMYTVSQHRTLQNQVKVGYVIRGEVNTNREHLNGPWSTVTDRLVAAAYQDPSLCKELCEHMNTSLDYSAFHEVREASTDAWKPSDFPASLCNPDEDVIVSEIRALEDILFSIRGNQYNAEGNLKMPHEYHVKDAVVVTKKKRKMKKVKEAK